jgi:hypothetical protein
LRTILPLFFILGCAVEQGNPLDTSAPASASTAVAASLKRAAPVSTVNGLHLPPAPADIRKAPEILDRCPEEKTSRPDFDSLARAKAAQKEALLSKAEPAPLSPPKSPGADQLKMQKRFLEAAHQRLSRLESLPRDERERAYDELKASMLKNNLAE